jgi:ankyrin repeat protein
MMRLYYRQLCDAVSRGDFETAKHLVEKDERSSGHKTFLMRACQQANKPIVIFFLNSGAAVNKTTRWGWTALMYSAKAGDEDIFNLLLKNSADIMKKDWWGGTVFHVAAYWNRKNMLDQLLLMVDLQCSDASSSPRRSAGFSWTVDIEDSDGHTPLWWATWNGHVDCVDVLLTHGANPDHKSKSMGSPLDIAKKGSRTSILNKMTEPEKYLCKGHSSPVLKRIISAQNEEIQSLKDEKEAQLKEIAGLKRELHQKDEKLRDSAKRIQMLESIFKQDGSSLDPEKVLQAVIGQGCDQWYTLCVKMGFAGAKVDAITHRMSSEADKIRAVFDKKTKAVGERAATQSLLKACKRLSDPIIGGVMDSLFNSVDK